MTFRGQPLVFQTRETPVWSHFSPRTSKTPHNGRRYSGRASTVLCHARSTMDQLVGTPMAVVLISSVTLAKIECLYNISTSVQGAQGSYPVHRTTPAPEGRRFFSCFFSPGRFLAFFFFSMLVSQCQCCACVLGFTTRRRSTCQWIG